MSQKLLTQKEGEKKTYDIVLSSNFDNTRTMCYFFRWGNLSRKRNYCKGFQFQIESLDAMLFKATYGWGTLKVYPMISDYLRNQGEANLATWCYMKKTGLVVQ